MFYVIWLMTAFAAVAVGILATSIVERGDKEN